MQMSLSFGDNAKRKKGTQFKFLSRKNWNLTKYHNKMKIVLYFSKLVLLLWILIHIAAATKTKDHKHKKLKKKGTFSPTVSLNNGWLTGGNAVDSNSIVPGVATLIDVEGNIFCNCEVVASNVCITSANCIIQSRIGTLGYVALYVTKPSDLVNAKKYEIDSVSIYPSNIQTKDASNLALVRIRDQFPPVAFLLSPFNPVLSGAHSAMYMGWGANSILGQPTSMREAPLNYKNSTSLGDGFYFDSPSNEICGGPSGGALYIGSYLTGVATEAISCSNYASPAYFFGIFYYYYWINYQNYTQSLPNNYIMSYQLVEDGVISAENTMIVPLFIPKGVNYAKFTVSLVQGNLEMDVQLDDSSIFCTALVSEVSNAVCKLFVPTPGAYSVVFTVLNGAVSGLSLKLEIGFAEAFQDVNTHNNVQLSQHSPFEYLSIPVLPGFPFTVEVDGDSNAIIIVAKGTNVPKLTGSSNLCQYHSSNSYCSFTVPSDTTVVSVLVEGSSKQTTYVNIFVTASKVIPTGANLLVPYDNNVPYSGILNYPQYQVVPGSSVMIQLDLFSGEATMNIYFSQYPISLYYLTLPVSCQKMGVVGTSVFCTLIVPSLTVDGAAMSNDGSPKYLTAIVKCHKAVFRLTIAKTVAT